MYSVLEGGKEALRYGVRRSLSGLECRSWGWALPFSDERAYTPYSTGYMVLVVVVVVALVSGIYWTVRLVLCTSESDDSWEGKTGWFIICLSQSRGGIL
ncbi:uncharacterized protein BP01DRAFT_154777 [Aspergillus saccharolyticus JOP 1030-1]|uniref:Uncharacterized protein n=1 Tax=Aspergillus saccharolyticus JOP 1030-1 TaxID=1450539 RepID=A0A318Z681_9EURO|nr:hypothetical protein BP01DRAFT_154777 [Aspergillus saccharolyticus JOP 1030-1]PYH41897.1 hypothetical protein BP01DRAFT_154777 [Aspergillus saccharolyticus JOP 1030-1]